MKAEKCACPLTAEADSLQRPVNGYRNGGEWKHETSFHHLSHHGLATGRASWVADLLMELTLARDAGRKYTYCFLALLD